MVNDIKIRKLPSPLGKTVAFVDITVGALVRIKDLKIVEGSKGLFVGWPSLKNKQGEWFDSSHPINADARTMVQVAILAVQQNKQTKKNQPPPQQKGPKDFDPELGF